MTYEAPYVDETGLHYSSYEDIKQFYTDGAKEIFGDDIYVDNDSMDGQLISIFAKGTYDSLKMIEYAFNNVTPQTAYGTVLSRLVLLSGISRKEGGYSTAYCTLTGDPFTIIRNGVVTDVSGNDWDLPSVVNLGQDGVISVTVTAEEKGNVTALAGTITTIKTPTQGWKTVYNDYAASPASEEETDTELRYRQRQSVALPSQGLVEGTQSALLNIDGVTDCLVQENDTSAIIVVDGVELPPHSITCIIEGGSEDEIAETIFYRKNQGCYCNGDIEVIQYDLYNNVNYIRFSRPTYVDIQISLSIKPISGYSSDITNEIIQNLVEYINSLKISNDVSISVLPSIINQSITDLTQPTYSITELKVSKVGGTLDTADIPILLNEKASLSEDNITVTIEGV